MDFILIVFLILNELIIWSRTSVTRLLLLDFHYSREQQLVTAATRILNKAAGTNNYSNTDMILE